MNLREKWRSRQRHSLLENTVMLYILQFSNMALGMLTQGYKMRVLGVELVGLLGAAQYTANFFLIFLDFGFLLSATAKISARREDKQELSRILSCVVAAKVIFTLISAVVLTVFIVPKLTGTGEVLAYYFFLLSCVAATMLPDYMYRGLEQMSAITIRAVAIKFVATALTFVLVQRPEDFYLCPLCTAIGNLGALAFVYWHLRSRVGVGFTRVSLREVWVEIKDSSQFLLSRMAASINSNLNGLLLKHAMPDAGLSIYTNPDMATGLYTSADTVIQAARNGMSPIADSLYPHMMKHRNFSIVKKALLFIYPVILLGCAFVFAFAEPLLTLWLGPEGRDVVLPLRLMIPVAVFCFPNYVLGYPTLGAMGLAKYANISTGFGTVIYLIGAWVCYKTVGISLPALCILSSVTEFSILLFRLAVIIKNRRLLQSPDEEGKK
ncbi:MAG: oligosaccharide flippase family protein [Acutalibacter muris]|nr:oligosaccharide flippase family protein [Acutalibacter muris]